MEERPGGPFVQPIVEGLLGIRHTTARIGLELRKDQLESRNVLKIDPGATKP